MNAKYRIIKEYEDDYLQNKAFYGLYERKKLFGIIPYWAVLAFGTLDEMILGMKQYIKKSNTVEKKEWLYNKDGFLV